MEKFYSKIDTDTLLHIVYRYNDMAESVRLDIVPESQFIQCSALRMNTGKTFKPHKHIWKNSSSLVIAQESWVVITGSVQCTFYDIDNTIIDQPILYAGDISVTLQGGHNYKILEDDTFVYEFKTGPYLGQLLDKTFIDEK
jgi:hypothetical protein